MSGNTDNPIVVGNGQTVIVPGGIYAGVPPLPLVPTALTGIPQATLQAWLIVAQTAMQNLMTGQQVFMVQYSEGQGHRSVTYTKSRMPELQMWITQLTYALGHRGRRPLRFGF